MKLFELTALTNYYFSYILPALSILTCILVIYFLTRKNLKKSSPATWHKIKNLLPLTFLPIIGFWVVWLNLTLRYSGWFIKPVLIKTPLIALSSILIFWLILWYKKISYRLIPLFVRTLLIGMFCLGTLLFLGTKAFLCFRDRQPEYVKAMAKLEEVRKQNK